MGQKVHPKGFRLGFTQDHLSNWYASPKDYAQYVIQDNELRQKLTLEGVSKIEIRRVPGQIRVWLYTSQQKQVLPVIEGIRQMVCTRSHASLIPHRLVYRVCQRHRAHGTVRT